MASERIRYQTVTASELVAGIDASQLDDRTPCRDWTVRGLLNHLVEGGLAFGTLFAGGEVDFEAAEGVDVVGEDARAMGMFAAPSEAADPATPIERLVVFVRGADDGGWTGSRHTACGRSPG